MKTNRNGRAAVKILGMVLVSLVFLSVGDQTSWAKYPEKPIVLLQPWPAGGGVDVSLRPLVSAASRFIGQPIVIEYHPGGSNAVALGILKNKRPDGYTIGLITPDPLINPYMRKVAYDFFKDFTPILQYGDMTFGLTVVADAPWKTFKDFIDYAKANPGKIRYSSAGPGAPAHFPMPRMGKLLNIEWTHIPFEGGPAAMAALLGNHVEAYSTTMQPKPQILAGRLRLLVTYGEKRIPGFPDIPTLLELGIPITTPSFLAIIGPKGLSPQIVEGINQAFKKAMEDPEFIKSCGMVDHIPNYRDQQETAKHFLKVDEELKNIFRDMKTKKD